MRDESDADIGMTPAQSLVTRAALWLMDRELIAPGTAVRVILFVMRGRA